MKVTLRNFIISYYVGTLLLTPLVCFFERFDIFRLDTAKYFAKVSKPVSDITVSEVVVSKTSGGVIFGSALGIG